MHTPLIIQTTGLTYGYQKGKPILSNIEMQVPKGSVYGFLGPNGSGKTTTLSLLLGLLPIQQGSIRLFGESLKASRADILQRTGSLIESPSIYGHLTAAENLEVYRLLYQLPKERINEILKIVRLEDTGNKKAKQFSLGMKQRLAIATALLPNPELLILDEPANGLDPSGIIELRALIKLLNEDYGMTILVSSHLLSEVEKVVSHLGIISGGSLVFQGSITELKQRLYKQPLLQVRTSDNAAAFELLSAFNPQQNCTKLLVPYETDKDIAQINRILLRSDLDIYLLQPKENNLEQLFIELTNTTL